jgi:hypothetical protein
LDLRLLPCKRCGVFRGMRPHVCESRRILRARDLAGIGTGPAPALLEFRGVIVEQFIHRHSRSNGKWFSRKRLWVVECRKAVPNHGAFGA